MSAPTPTLRSDTILFMGGITALTAVSVDIVTPATGVVARDLGVADSLGAMLVGIYFIAFGAGQLFWGVFSDAYGRRLALKISLSGFILASLACAFTPTFEVLLVARFAQGLMAGAPIIARAMVRDVASGTEGARLMTLLGAILTIAAMFAPVLGSGLLILFSWRASFWALTALALVFLAYTLLSLPETTGRRRPERFSFRFVASAGRFLLTTRAFVVPMLAGSLTFGGYVSLLSTGAIVAEARYGISPETFGALFALAALVNTCGAFTARALLKDRSLRQVGTIALTVLGLAAILHGVLLATDPGLQLFWGAVCLYVLAFGMILPTAMAAALEPAGEMPGFAASIMGAVQMAIATGAAAIASALYDGSHLSISLSMAGFGLAAVTVVALGRLSDRR